MSFWEGQRRTEGRSCPVRDLPAAPGFLAVQQLPRPHLLPEGEKAESWFAVSLGRDHRHFLFVHPSVHRADILAASQGPES